jgi:hypothetical protein
MVIENLQKNAAQAKKIIQHVLSRLPLIANWPAHEGLKNALLTDKRFWPAKTKSELKLILRKYL